MSRRVVLDMGAAGCSVEPFPRGLRARMRFTTGNAELSVFGHAEELRSLATALHDTADEMEAREAAG